MDHTSAYHFYASLALLAVAGFLALVAGDSWLRRRLRLTVILAAVAAALHLVVGRLGTGGYIADISVFERLILVLGFVHGAVTVVFNSWVAGGDEERTPGIVQNALVLGVFGLFATIAFPGQLLATSAVGAVIMGFAVQDTLSNFFAGLALQIDPPFKSGHWIEVAGFQGRVREITWRATKIQTKTGNLVVVPNNIIGKEAINNYSEPQAPTALAVEVGTGYQHPPNVVHDALLAAMRRCPKVLSEPEPDVVMKDFGASALIFQARFWVDDFSKDVYAGDEVRRAIFYEFNRRQIEIPWPIQIEYSRQETPRDIRAQRERFAETLAAVPILAALPPEGRTAVAGAAAEHLYARGEAVVTEGEPGDSMFVVLEGSVAISVGEDRREVAVIHKGGYFGEMSLLTGDRRSASAIATCDTSVLEIPGDAFATYVQSHPTVLDAIATAATVRRLELDEVKRAPGTPQAPAAASLLARMRQFFRVY